jgi:hypothetical protein
MGSLSARMGYASTLPQVGIEGGKESRLKLTCLQQNSRQRTRPSRKQICTVRKVEYTGCMSLYHRQALYDSRFFAHLLVCHIPGLARVSLVIYWYPLPAFEAKSYETALSTSWLRYALLRDSTVYLSARYLGYVCPFVLILCLIICCYMTFISTLFFSFIKSPWCCSIYAATITDGRIDLAS